MPPIDYANIAAPVGGEDNMGGTTQVIYYAPIRDFDEIATLDPAGTTMASRVEITDDHTFLTGKCFKTMYVTMDSGQLDTEMQGERDGESWKEKANFFTPGAAPGPTGAMDQLLKDKCIVLIPLPDGKVRQLGSKDFYAEFKPKWSTGKNGSARRGWTVDIESMTHRPLIYSGAISTTPAP